MIIASVSTDLKLHSHEKLLQTYENLKDTPRQIKWSDDGKYIVQSGVGVDIDVLSASEERIRNVQHVPVENSTVAIFRHGSVRNLAIGCRSGKTFIWDLKLKHVIKTFTANSSVKYLDFNCKDTFLAAAVENGDTHIFGVTTNTSLDTIKVPQSKSVSSLAFHRKVGSWLGIATEEGSLLVRDVNNGKDKMFTKMAHAAPISGITFSHINKDVLASCSLDKKVLIHDIRLQTVVSQINTDKFLTCVDMDSESFIALGTNIGEVVVYDLRKFVNPFQIFNDHKTTVHSVAFQPFNDKIKRNFSVNLSLRDTNSPKPNVQTSKTSDVASFCDLINTTFSPISGDSVDSRNGDVNKNHDLSLLNIIDTTGMSCMTNFDSRECISASKLGVISDSPRLMGQPLLELNGKNSVSTSTPVVNKTQSGEVTPSKYANIKNRLDGSVNSDPKVNARRKNTDPMVSPSETETVVGNKCNSDCLSTLGSDIKDHITYSMYDIIEKCRDNHQQMVIIETKNRLFLEDQIHVMNQKMEGMQQLLCTLLEENKKLSFEMEMLRAARK